MVQRLCDTEARIVGPCEHVRGPRESDAVVPIRGHESRDLSEWLFFEAFGHHGVEMSGPVDAG